MYSAPVPATRKIDAKTMAAAENEVTLLNILAFPIKQP
jgi:hypothetical protein